MGYLIDLSEISLDQYKDKLATGYMIPSRKILKDRLEERFSCFKNNGIHNVQELVTALKNKLKFEKLLKEQCFDSEYLQVLRREVNSIQTKPLKISEFHWINPELVTNLAKLGIKDTSQLFDKVLTNDDRINLAKQTGVNHQDILELTKLTDLTRIKWVGANFARVLFESGYDTVEKVKVADYQILYNAITNKNNELNLYKGKIGLNDTKLCVEVAHDVSLDVQY